MKLKFVAPPDPRIPAPMDETVASALQAVVEGRGTEAQQVRAMKWIINYASGVNNGSKFHENDRIEAFALGRAFVGEQIVGALRIELAGAPLPAQAHMDAAGDVIAGAKKRARTKRDSAAPE